MCVAPSKRAAATPSDALLPNNIPMSHATPPKGQLESHSLCVLWLRFQVHNCVRRGHNIEGSTVVLADSLIRSRYRIPGTPYVPPTTRQSVPRPLYHTWHHNPLIATCMIGWGMACDRGDGGFHRNVQPNASRYPSA